MSDHADARRLIRHDRVVAVAGIAGATVLVIFRALIELGFGPAGSLRVFGWPLEYVFLAWFLALGALAFERAKLSGAAWLRVTIYEWWLSIVGLAGSIWLVQDLGTHRFIISESWVYPLACGCVVAVFVSASVVDRPTPIGLSHIFPDALRIMRRPVTWACAIGAISLLGFAPRSFEIPTEGPAFRRWYVRQMRESVPASWQVRPVTLVELADYQCPACRQAASRYQELIRNARESYGDAFAFLRVDFPLEDECNPGAGGLHPASCEAAAAVRLARSEGVDKEREVVNWLWRYQRDLTTDKVFDGVREQFGIDVRGPYRDLLPGIRRDAAEGRRLGVSSTPTYFLN